MASWEYNSDEYNSDGYGLIPQGEYRVRIDSVEEKVSRTGKDMYVLMLSVSGQNVRVWDWVVFDSSSEEARKRTNQKLGSIFDSFNIPKGDMNIYDWKGKTGGAKIRHKPDLQGEMRAAISYFLPRKKVDALPAWQEGWKKSTSTSSTAQKFISSAIIPEAYDPDTETDTDITPF